MDFRRAEAVDINLGEPPLDVAEQLLVQASGSSGCIPPCNRIWLPPKAIVSSILRASSSRSMTYVPGSPGRRENAQNRQPPMQTFV